MLYILPTPVGNIDDMTKRSMDAIQMLSHLICEDTRHTKKLLKLLDIDYQKINFYSLTSFTNDSKLSFFVRLLQEHDVGLVSDAGTPGLSDPGKRLIELCHQHSISYTVFPGPNALIPAVVSAAFDTSKFVFLGFLPTKKWRQTALQSIINSSMPVFVYESVHRLEKTLEQIYSLWFRGTVSMSREISKMHEQIITAPIAEVIHMIANKAIPLKGEFVIGFSKS